jgi:hypothetical protein
LARRWPQSGQNHNEIHSIQLSSNESELDVHHHLIGPLWGNIIIIGIAGAITVACFAAMFWMLARPGETDPRHAKYMVLRHDR